MQRLEPVVIEIERERECVVVVGHQAVLRALYGYFTKTPLAVRPCCKYRLCCACCATCHTPCGVSVAAADCVSTCPDVQSQHCSSCVQPWAYVPSLLLSESAAGWEHSAEMCCTAPQEVPRLEIPLHTLIELVPKPDGKMAEERVHFDLVNESTSKVMPHYQTSLLIDAWHRQAIHSSYCA